VFIDGRPRTRLLNFPSRDGGRVLAVAASTRAFALKAGLLHQRVYWRIRERSIYSVLVVARVGKENEMIQDILRKPPPKEASKGSSLLSTSIESLPVHVCEDAESRYVLNGIVRLKGLGTSAAEEIVEKTDLCFYARKVALRYRSGEQEITQLGQLLGGTREPGQGEEGNRRRRWWR